MVLWFDFHPQQLNNFLKFCKYRNDAKKTNSLNLSKCDWIFPSTLLPLGVFLRENSDINYTPPDNQSVAEYISLMVKGCNLPSKATCSYLPLIELPKDEKDAGRILKGIYDIHNGGKEYGGEQAFKYLINELTDNIYQHSEFQQAFIMAQRYKQHKFVEICFYDNGITINGSFKKNGLIIEEDYGAIAEAINGLSTKNQTERGFGLGSNFKIFTQGLNGEILIVSGSGAIYVNKQQRKAYKFQESNILMGTMISVKVPFPAKEIDIYDYL